MNATEKIKTLREALTRISHPADHGCGCSHPCMCNTPEAEKINAEVMRDIAEKALAATEQAEDREHTVVTKENAHEAMEKILWDFVDVAGAFPGVHPDPRVWPHVFAYIEKPSETKAPQISSEHLIELARRCRIYGAYTTKEFKDAVVGYARVVLNDKAIHESFIRENNGCFTSVFGTVGQDKQEQAGMARDAGRYQWLRSKPVDSIKSERGVFIGIVPDNMAVNGEDADKAIDDEMAAQKGQQ